MSDGLSFKKSVASKPPLGWHRIGGDVDVRTGSGKESPGMDLSSEISPKEPKKDTYDREKDESGESNYLPHSRVI